MTDPQDPAVEALAAGLHGIGLECVEGDGHGHMAHYDDAHDVVGEMSAYHGHTLVTNEQAETVAALGRLPKGGALGHGWEVHYYPGSEDYRVTRWPYGSSVKDVEVGTGLTIAAAITAALEPES